MGEEQGADFYYTPRFTPPHSSFLLHELCQFYQRSIRQATAAAAVLISSCIMKSNTIRAPNQVVL